MVIKKKIIKSVETVSKNPCKEEKHNLRTEKEVNNGIQFPSGRHFARSPAAHTCVLFPPTLNRLACITNMAL
jgi:hypothetical protein